MSFEGHNVLITGAAGRLGQAVGEAFAEQGARLVLIERHTVTAPATAGNGPGRITVGADLLDARQTRAAVATALEQVSRIDVLCHLAGGFRMGEAVHETTDSTWNFLTDINERTLLNIARVVVPHMIERGGGKIITVASNAARQGAAYMGAYSASKSGVIRLTEAMSSELKEQNINVNCVLPTVIDTPENRAAMPDQDPSRWVSARALADVIVFLASDAARAVHGAALPVAGLV